MRHAVGLLVVLGAGCTHVPPIATLRIDGREIDQTDGVIDVRPGAPVRIGTYWGESCGGRSGINALGISPRSSEHCNQVRHVVRIRCTTPCVIEAPDGRRAEAELAWGPTLHQASFTITPLTSTLGLHVVMEAGRDRRDVPMPTVRFVERS